MKNSSTLPVASGVDSPFPFAGASVQIGSPATSSSEDSVGPGIDRLGAGAGFLILSTGAHRRTLLWECLAGIRRHYPETPVHVISDVPVDCPFTWLKHYHGKGYNGVGSRRYKTQLARLSPFETTVVLDDDTIIHRPFGRADEHLQGADIAMASAFVTPDLQSFLRKGKRGGHARKARAAVNETNLHKPYFNSGVMIFRRSETVFRLFDAWHEDWLPHQHMDQQPLITAIERTGTRVERLSPSMNYIPHVQGAGLPYREMPANILHFIRGKANHEARYLQEMGLCPAEPHARFKLFAELVAPKGGWCSASQYRAMGAVISDRAPCRLLVFGGGKDSQLWASLNTGGRTVFVENLSLWRRHLERHRLDVVSYDYRTLRGTWDLESSPPPPTIDQPWDIVIIDGPRGEKPNTPGRELPVKWGAHLPGSPVIFIHDWQRPWEQAVCDRYLGMPDTIVSGDKRQGDLAVWLRGRPLVRRLYGYV